MPVYTQNIYMYDYYTLYYIILYKMLNVNIVITVNIGEISISLYTQYLN